VAGPCVDERPEDSQEATRTRVLAPINVRWLLWRRQRVLLPPRPPNPSCRAPHCIRANVPGLRLLAILTISDRSLIYDISRPCARCSSPRNAFNNASVRRPRVFAITFQVVNSLGADRLLCSTFALLHLHA
jgi:hypothetical protein